MVNTIGYLAATCTTVCFIPQAVRLIRTRNTAAISLTMYSLFTVGLCFWLTYGILSKSTPIIVANSITLVFAFTILYCKIKYK